MKLIRFGEYRKEKPGVELEDGTRKDLSGHFSDWDWDFFNNDGLAKLETVLSEKGPALPEVPAGARIGCPVDRPGKIVCIGLNYADHAEESGMDIPTEPVIFMCAHTLREMPNDLIMHLCRCTLSNYYALAK